MLHCTATEKCLFRKANKVGKNEKKKEFWSSVQSHEKYQEQEMTKKVTKKRMRKKEPSCF